HSTSSCLRSTSSCCVIRACRRASETGSAVISRVTDCPLQADSSSASGSIALSTLASFMYHSPHVSARVEHKTLCATMHRVLGPATVAEYCHEASEHQRKRQGPGCFFSSLCPGQGP